MCTSSIGPIQSHFYRDEPDVRVNAAGYGEHGIERDVVIAHSGKLHLVDRIPNLSKSAIISLRATARREPLNGFASLWC
jgi:hypothetical protein